jgi:hypothetical protein
MKRSQSASHHANQTRSIDAAKLAQADETKEGADRAFKKVAATKPIKR